MMAYESVAYASAHSSSDKLSRMTLFVRKHATAVAACFAFALVVIFMNTDEATSSTDSIGKQSLRVSSIYKKSIPLDPHWGGAAHKGYFHLENSVVSKNVFRFAAVTDMDELSRVPDSSKPIFHSLLLPGTLTYDPSADSYSVQLDETRELISKHNEAGRGMELSELTLYKDRLLAFDDRTGSVFEILSKDAGQGSLVVPRFVITEGDGDTDKGMKWEWATVKGNDLIMGSMGKEYTKPNGEIENTNNLWLAIINEHGEIRRIDWTEQYTFVRAALGASAPGYVIHEAVLWSDHLKKWAFLPRRVSADMYDENLDERKGTNKLLLVNEDFTDSELVEIQMKEVDPLHGFSSFAFVPGTKDRHAIALRSVEEDCVGGDESLCKQRSYMIAFDVLTGKVLMDEVMIDGKVKYEGIEFVDITTPETVFG